MQCTQHVLDIIEFKFNRAAVSCLGEMYEKLGRMMGRSYEETVQLLSRSFKNMESQSRIETMLTFEKVNNYTSCSRGVKHIPK